MSAIRRQPLLLLAFLREMPKGADLHNHLGGAIYAENLIDFAAHDGDCLDLASGTAVPPPCDAGCEGTGQKPAIACAYRNQPLYNNIVDAWSMRNWERGRESGHDHFFATFNKFNLATAGHTGEALTLAAEQAAADHLQMLELMHSADHGQAAALGAKLGWHADFGVMRDELLKGGLKEIVAAATRELDANEAAMRQALACGTAQAMPACDITLRYLYSVLRGQAPERVFAQILAGFEMASSDARYLGLNLVMPEDSYIPMRDFELHLKMLDYLHGVYPKVHITLHAGELAPGLVPPEGLSFHIRDSVETGHAERIGHGVDAMNERDAPALLREMAKRNVLVEICLTSNDVILGIKGDQHPFPVYRRFGVPVALATDDEGVSRSDLTHEYLRAALTYDLSYSDLKNMARQSLEHSFLPGRSLWSDTQRFRMVPACLGQSPQKEKAVCREFLDTNERARLQWKLEGEFARFESKH